MRTRLLIGLAAVAMAAPVHAEKVPQEFRTVFERTFSPGRTYAVVMQEGVPTTSIYGVEGDQTAAHYSIDIVDGRWKTSQGLLDMNQTAADFFEKGEILELKSISWKDDRVDLRFESTEAHKVTRGALFLKDTKREPVATNFKFFFPFAVTGARDVPKAVQYIERFVKPFSSEQQARSFARGGGKSEAPKAPAARKTTKQELKVGMTALEVIEIMGKPEKETTFGTKSRWNYPDLIVMFENGRVTEVKF